MSRMCHYQDHIDHPELVELCVNCTNDDCPGICAEYRQMFKALFKREQPAEAPKKREVVKLGKHNVPFEAFGESHTIKEWATRYGIEYITLYMRIRSGIDMETALTMEPPKKTWMRLVTIDGYTLSISDWARQMGINRCTIYARMRRGMSVEDAIRTPLQCQRRTYDDI